MNQKTRIFSWAAAMSILALTLSACGLAAPAEPTQDPNMVFTQVAETVMVSMTQTAEAMPPTPTPEPTATPQPTPTTAPTIDPATIPTQGPAAPLAPTATIQRFGDSAQFNTQSPMDGKVFKTGEDFAFHVCLGNNGSTEWNTKYYLEFVSGNRLWSNTKYFYVGSIVKHTETKAFENIHQFNKLHFKTCVRLVAAIIFHSIVQRHTGQFRQVNTFNCFEQMTAHAFKHLQHIFLFYE